MVNTAGVVVVLLMLMINSDIQYEYVFKVTHTMMYLFI
jgi:hypothetical protein